MMPSLNYRSMGTKETMSMPLHHSQSIKLEPREFDGDTNSKWKCRGEDVSNVNMRTLLG